MKSEWIEIDVAGSAMPSFVVRNEARPNAPGIVVLQEIFGVNAEMRRIAELVASDGFTALVPNFYHRTHPGLDAPYNDEGFEIGAAAARATTLEGLTADVIGSVRWLQDHGAPKVGTWGFCFGGSLAFLSATFPEVRAAVSFYGAQIAKSQVPTRPPLITLVDRIQCPIFLAFGGKDRSIPAEDVEAIRKALAAAGKEFELDVYPDEGHAFFRHGVTGEATPAARAVWQKVQTFLHKHLS
jgi:carboxymethylenebutenolidase